ncbi:hypothetical protein MF271_00630 (plasmid) [Deinococcus sp. KNUC1210]|uniref:hypothetical protein n=1 Tax=Deinococcus sp. KNUC1210 TaxID=2917691 RepID=UPI001EF0835C|nr:hypothetical protein [Deinococcus sp. KNUC1210]ULH14018.1 hypothetical protein MF271_00630 [Deinococcus sp. KNUC1210]
MSSSDQQVPSSAAPSPLEAEDGIVDAGEVQDLNDEFPASEDGEISVPGPRPSRELRDAGEIKGVGSKEFDSYKNKIRMHHSWTAILLAFSLVAVLVISTLLHYHTVEQLYLTNRAEAAKQLSTIFDKWFPVITGFTGSAITYFLTRDRS